MKEECKYCVWYNGTNASIKCKARIHFLDIKEQCEKAKRVMIKNKIIDEFENDFNDIKSL